MATEIAEMRIYHFHGAGPTATNIDNEDGSGPAVFGLADAVNAGGTPLTAPSATGNVYSYHKTVALYCASGGGSSDISDREIYLSAGLTTGFYLWYDEVGATYTQASSGNKVADNGSAAGTGPGGGFAALNTTPASYDASSVAATNATRNGAYVQLICSIGSNYAGTADAAASLGNLLISYIETES